MTNWVSSELAGWGRYPVTVSEVARPERLSEVFEAFDERNGEPVLARGLGRSYGDAALLDDGRVILTRRLDRMLDFDPDSGWLRCEAGVSLEEIIDTFLPRGFFPPVVPGTQYVTVGGAVGCNIHGKNHHIHGCFGDHVRRIELLTGTGDIVECDRDNYPDLFWATVGGMGLTGLILSLEVQLYPVESSAIEMESIRVDNLDEFFEVSAESGDFTHTVSWVDCLKTGRSMGRGIYMRGRHAPANAVAEPGIVDRLVELLGRVVNGKPLESDAWVNAATMRLFNEAYFRKTPPGTTRATVDYVPFFFPLDAVPNWNYLYGPRGFFQYQLVVRSREAARECLEEVSKSGYAAFLNVIKEFGDRDHGGLSFPMKGTTIALDFANSGPGLFELFERLDDIVIADGGRVYLGKDARLPAEKMRRMYPDWQKWKSVRDEWDPEGVFRSELGQRLELV